MCIEESIEELKDYLDNGSNFGTRYFNEAIENVLKELETSKNENIKKDKVIQEMVEELNREYSSYEPCPMEYKVNCDNQESCINCIKEYFYKKVEGEK